MTVSTTPYSFSRLSPPVGDTGRELGPYPNQKIISIITGHIFLGIFSHFSPMVATLHALGVGIVVFYFVISNSDIRRYMLIMAYAASSEVLWRMSQASVPWMYAEYLVLFTIVFGMMRIHGNTQTLFLPLYYVLTLLPSVFITMLGTDLAYGRELVAFNLSGPIALGLGMFVVSRFRIDIRQLHKSMLYAIFPVVSVVTITIIAVYFEGVEFRAISQSNKAAAGGYAPNQVSSAMSFGITMLLFMLFVVKEYKPASYIFRLLLIVFITQMLLTLSRGGTISALAVLIFGFPFFLQTKRSRQRFLVTITVSALVLWFLILPSLEELTGGAIGRRYNDESTTNRTTLMEYELNAFYDSPLLGQGPGNASNFFETGYLSRSASHTEYTRVLAEHGLSGGLGLIFLAISFLYIFLKAKTMVKKGIIVGSAAWIFSYFLHSASRTVPFAFLGMFAVLVANSIDDEPHEESQAE